MKIKEIKKRSGITESFDENKITQAVLKAMNVAKEGSVGDATTIMQTVLTKLEDIKDHDEKYVPSVEGVQNIVEKVLMKSDFEETAKAYILYRNERIKARTPDIFKKRINLKPYEYPQLLEYVDAIRHSYWIHTEFKFDGDVQDFKVHLSEHERDAIRKTMLAISQIEVAVKTFWGNLYSKLPKPEIGSVGATFAESEVRHHDAYSHLLEILGLNREFEKIKQEPIFMQRVEYLEKAISNANSEDKQKYSESILLFSLFIEHVSLFSQFLIIMSFNKYNDQFKGISNVVEATSKEEQIHGNFGIDVINIIKQENPSWFDETHSIMVQNLCLEAYESECKLIEWIFEKGEFSFLPKKVIFEFIKQRFNNSLKSIGIPTIFEINQEVLEKTNWFDEEIMATKHVDFFAKRSINYSKRTKSVTGDDLF
jgi:ribonucleoside-diphosphate reductase beta chain